LNGKAAVMAIKQTLRIALDIAMIAILLFAYNTLLARETAHIFIGVALFILFTVHIFINRYLFIIIFKGSYIHRRILLTVINGLLLLTAATLVITGILEALWVPSFLNIENGITIRQIHTTAAYWLLPLIGVHLGFHWRMFSKYISKSIFIITIMRILAFLFFVFGVWSFIDRDMFAKMFLGFSFDYWSQEKPIILFYAQTLSIMGIFVFATYYLLKLIVWLKTGNKK
jgi:hypothetical protein